MHDDDGSYDDADEEEDENVILDKWKSRATSWSGAT